MRSETKTCLLWGNMSDLSLCNLDPSYDPSLELEAFLHNRDLCFGGADFLVQALVQHLGMWQLLLGLLKFVPIQCQLPLQLSDVSNASLVLWGENKIYKEWNKAFDSLFWLSNPAWCKCCRRPFWTASACSCCFHRVMLSTSLSKILFLCLSLWRASSAYCLSASSRSIRYMTSPRTSFIFLNSGFNGQLSSGWEPIQVCTVYYSLSWLWKQWDCVPDCVVILAHSLQRI